MSLPDLCQIDLAVTDLKRACSFYREVFGWHEEPADFHAVAVLRVAADSPYGMVLRQSAATGCGGLRLYFRCEAAAAVASRVLQHGGRVLEECQRVPGYGSVWMIEDPDGNAIGLFES